MCRRKNAGDILVRILIPIAVVCRPLMIALRFSFQDLKLHERKRDFFTRAQVFSRHAQGTVFSDLESKLDARCAARGRCNAVESEQAYIPVLAELFAISLHDVHADSLLILQPGGEDVDATGW